METHIGAKHISSSLLIKARYPFVHHPILLNYCRWSSITMLVLVVCLFVCFLTELRHCRGFLSLKYRQRRSECMCVN